ncbi:MAG: hypothetical protein B6I22_07350 [Desulfobacteraceae bacterium 4572_123]|nr:MAG: hypothetical protein B6I22_07350 [Desulfobacteraceae bacterium 4572_123]
MKRVRAENPESTAHMIDIHCHILPGIDDGPLSIAESLVMVDQALADGIKTIVATPHTFNGVYTTPSEAVTGGVDSLNRILTDKNIRLRICPGAEVHTCDVFSRKIIDGLAGTINHTGKYVLVEFPFQTINPGTSEELFQLKLKGITPIIAHPERNILFQRDIDQLYDIVGMGCLVQITAMSITGELGTAAMGCAHTLLQRHLAHVIASDAHSPGSRPPILSNGVDAAADILGSMAEARKMVTDIPRAILCGDSIEIPDPLRPLEMKKKWWQVFR